MKKCSLCSAFKPIEDFYIYKDKPIARCKRCVIKVVGKRTSLNKEKVKEYKKAYYEKQVNDKGEFTAKQRRAIDGFKVCSCCKIKKSIDNFTKQKRNADCLHNRCRSCKKETIDKYVAKNKEGVISSKKRYHFNKMYNMTLEHYDEMVKAQGGVCKICGNPPTIHKRLSIDHCHVTNKIRGLLCANCNTGLGNFNDSVKLLTAAAKYLNIPMERPKAVAIDLDDCVLTFLETVLDFHNNKYKTDFKKEEMKVWDLPHEVNKTFLKYERQIYSSLGLKEGALEAIESFKNKGFKIIFITARKPKYRSETEFSLDRLGVYYDELFFNSRKAIKLNRLEELFNVHIFVDDKPENVNSVKKGTNIKKVYLINMPSNKESKLKRGIIRINNLHEIEII